MWHWRVYRRPQGALSQALLDELNTNEWWQDVTLPMLETMRRRIRGLVMLIERVRRGIVYTDFEDQLGEITLPELHGIPTGTNRSRFEEKVRAWLRLHENELAVQKLRRNRQITPVDIQFLEKVIVGAGYGTTEEIERVAVDHQGFGLFLRSLTGLDREAAKAAFDKFHAGRNLSSRQLDFINMTIDHLAKNGIIDIGLLYEQPFTSLAPGGPETIFENNDVDAIVTVLDAIRATAVPA